MQSKIKDLDKQKKGAESLELVNFASKLSIQSLKDIETQETEDGLLIKGIPVFKAGTYRDTVYDKDYIDRNFIGQFSSDDDIPIQADHNPSVYATLGWVKNLYRKSKTMYSDFLLTDENAIARWKKGLLKKFSIGVDLMHDRIREISIVAFPYVKSARIHSEDVAEDGFPIEVTEVNGAYFITIEGEQYEVKPNETSTNAPGNMWMFIPINSRDENGEIRQEEYITITDEDIDNIDIKEDIAEDTDYGVDDDGESFSEEDFANWSTKYKNSLPDSSFLLVKKPVKDKNGDRALPIKDKDGKISRPHIKNSLARADQVKGFTPALLAEAKAKLQRIFKKLGMLSDDKSTEVKTMLKLDELKKLDLSKIEGSEILKEAIEHITALEQERDNAVTKSNETAKQIDELSKKIKTSTVNEKVAELKAAGKITPAQEESTKAFMLTLSDEKIQDFVKVMSSNPKVVDLSEAGKGSDDDASKDKLDIDKLEAADINRVAEKLAKDNSVDFNEALDWCYDGKVSKEGKLLS